MPFGIQSKLEEESWEQERQRILDDFKSANNDQPSCSVPYPQSVPFFSGYGNDQYNKVTHHLNSGHAVNIISKNGFFKSPSVLWHTSSENVRTALRYGMLKPQALTSVAIGKVGRYKLKVADRAVKSCIISNKAIQKDKLVDIFQDRVELLQPLERLVNLRINPQKERPYLSEIENYIQSLNDYKDKITKDTNLDSIFKKYDRRFQRYLIDRIDVDIKNAEKLLINIKDALKNGKTDDYYDDEIFNFVANQTRKCLNELKAGNQIISYGRHDHSNRGDLNSYCEEATFAIDDYVNNKRDFHNPITKKHQMDFSDEKGIITIDSTHHTTNGANELEKFLLGISVIEEENKLDLQQKKLGDCVLKETSATKWGHVFSFFSAGSIQTIQKIKDFFTDKEVLKTRDQNKYLYKVKFYEFAESLRANSNSLLTRTFAQIHKYTTSTLWNNLKGIGFAIADSFRSLAKISSDIDGSFFLRKQQNTTNLLRDLTSELDQINKAREEAVESVNQGLRTANVGKQGEATDKQKVNTPNNYAVPEYALRSYHSDGVLNTLADGTEEFFKMFTLHLYAKHPFTGLIFTGAYATFALPILFPHAAAGLVGTKLTHIAQSWGNIFGHGPHSSAASGGFAAGKLAAGTFEFALHGFDSWLVEGLSDILSDPINTVLAAGLTFAIGYMITDKLNIPWLSAYLEGDVGKAWPLELSLIGAKATLAAYDLLFKTGADQENVIKEFLAFSSQKYGELYKRIHGKSLDLNDTFSEDLEKHMRNSLNSVLTILQQGNPEEIDPKRKKLKTLIEQLQSLDPAQTNALNPAQTNALNPAQTNALNPAQANALNPAQANALNPAQTNALDPAQTNAPTQEDCNRIQLLTKLAENSDNLKYLSTRTKENLKAQLPHITGSEECAKALEQIISPPRKLPAVGNFVRSTLNYVVLAARCTLGVFSLTPRPYEDLGKQIKNDVGSTFYAVGKLFRVVSNILFVRAPKTVGDIVVNQVTARTIGIISNDQTGTKVAYAASNTYDRVIDTLAATLKLPLDNIAENGTTLAPERALSDVNVSALTPTHQKKPYSVRPFPDDPRPTVAPIGAFSGGMFSPGKTVGTRKGDQQRTDTPPSSSYSPPSPGEIFLS